MNKLTEACLQTKRVILQSSYVVPKNCNMNNINLIEQHNIICQFIHNITTCTAQFGTLKNTTPIQLIYNYSNIWSYLTLDIMQRIYNAIVYTNVCGNSLITQHIHTITTFIFTCIDKIIANINAIVLIHAPPQLTGVLEIFVSNAYKMLSSCILVFKNDNNIMA